jgi:DedD protein
MEKNKLLLVAGSVGIFLIVALGAALVINSIEKTDPSVVARQPYAPGMSGTLVPNISNIETPVEISQAANIPETDTQTETAHQPSASVVDKPGSVDTISLLNKPEINILQPAPEAKIPDSINHVYGDAGTKGSPNVRIETYTPAGAAARSSEPIKLPAAPVSKPPAASVPSTQVTKAPVKTYDDFWVQTGSFSTKVRADNVKESLGAKGIGSVIEVRNVNEQTWYRVRVGPYTSQNEAQYWLSLIQAIDGFEESQIWQSQSTR